VGAKRVGQQVAHRHLALLAGIGAPVTTGRDPRLLEVEV
jgi:hypothetical protein